jgi:hypothetical protein
VAKEGEELVYGASIGTRACGSGRLRHDEAVSKKRPAALGRKFARISALIQDIPGLDEHERILFARSLAATPTQRWQIHNNVLRSLVFSSPSARKRFGL